MWFARPQIQSGKYVFQPNKITYHVPVTSDLGKQIRTAQAGIAVHGFFKTTGQVEASPVDVTKLKLKPIPQIVVLGSKIPSGKVISIADESIGAYYKFVEKNAKAIDHFLNPEILRGMQMTDFGKLLKSFLAAKAASGQETKGNLGQQCYKWIGVNTSISEAKRTRMLEYIRQNVQVYYNIWKIVSGIVQIKTALKKHFDKQTSGMIAGMLAGSPGHEGFVIDGPAKIKLVDRHVFMHEKAPRFAAKGTK
jgi:hypothetical protein